MISTWAKTIWKGRIGIREKYVTEALEKKEDLVVRNGIEIMLIPYNLIQKSIIGRSKVAFPNYFGEGRHYLIYFQWKPNENQKKLF